jgi:LytS/YehU family sensor histidine kinase
MRGTIMVNTDINVMLGMLLFMSGLSLVHGIIALVMKGFINWYRDIKIKEELQQKNFATELALVKSQLSPHFLFNTINNIDVLIEKDATRASAYLNKLSDIIRFMLYETKGENIPLQKELAYIDKYIDLQKIRTANTNFIQYTAEGNTAAWSIAPMLFIPFIENAFKHSGNKKTDHAIVIRITAADKALHFHCENHTSENPMIGHKAGGLGNELIAKRLGLLYPGKHTLEMKKENNIFKVQLTIYAD